MKKRIVFICLLFAFLCQACRQEKEETSFHFNREGQFKIAQFTDFHWNNSSPNSERTRQTILAVLEAEKPDLAVLTGDVVTDGIAKEGWLAVARIFEEAKTNWAVLLGNHDGELQLTRREIFRLLEGLPYYVGEAGPEQLSGSGNYTIPVSGSTGGKPAAMLYFLDSNDYRKNRLDGYYDWIRADQIAWFRETNGLHKELPSLVFFHIPTTEFLEVVGKETTLGTKNEGVASPEINSGFFSAMYEAGSVMGAFVGHDHENDYIGINHGIALAFGRTTGADAYGELERGARIILLHEGEKRFDTWIRTPKGTEWTYYFPSGLSRIEEDTMQYLPSRKVEATGPGLHATYYEGGSFTSVEDITRQGKEIRSEKVTNFSIASAGDCDSFAFVFSGLIDIPKRGVYRFYTDSDDGSVLYIDGQRIVDNDGSHSLQRADGKVALEEGLHEIEVRYFEDYMGQSLEVGWVSRKIPEGKIPDSVLFRTAIPDSPENIRE